ncbi:protein mono-ADP-ribosyltransferase PARP11-like isoform X2 [Polyodon spathula]|uniref:protein mono-ADP-ribosyltransferase PARP11-like isoform X2 n=1 Tax=Polyodon spathula TaxID=7913 RepID=UPI001B7EA6DE|nr:protein mono-ADP-ribosyltransferase PARP11-like isoform X2 [Polyodon spathula]
MAGFEEVEHMEVAMDTSDTPWCWFYLAECGLWHMFELGSNCQCSVSSEEIERSYRMNERGMSFTTAKYNYMLDFSEMKQINMSTGKQRPIKRALFRLISEDQANPVPPYWEKVNTEEPYQLIHLQEDTNEYKEVARFFKNTMHVCITAIKRIQNLDLWEFFCRKKAQLKRRNQGAEIEEKMVFHGTSHENIEAICTNNFDCRLNGSHGTVFGKATWVPLRVLATRVPRSEKPFTWVVPRSQQPASGCESTCFDPDQAREIVKLHFREEHFCLFCLAIFLLIETHRGLDCSRDEDTFALINIWTDG